VNIVFVLARRREAVPLWDIIGPVKKAGDRVEFWLPGQVSESWLGFRSPDLVIYGAAAEGESTLVAGFGSWDLRCHEGRLRWLLELYAERRPGLVLFPPAGRELGIRLAARLNCGCFPETRTLLREGEGLFARKKVCGSNLDWDVEIKEYPAVVTVAGRQSPREDLEGDPLESCRMESRPAEYPGLPPWILDYELSEAPPVSPLESAPLIFAAGRGLGSRAACERLRRAAGRFGAPLGFSRPAALNGWGEVGEIIGQSGLRSGAEICVAVGVSGAAAFMAGIEAATLIAVNPDRNAPIFRYADIGLITGAEEFTAALEAEALMKTGNP
jgi:electron transfer flavoprotein alpha subunit